MNNFRLSKNAEQLLLALNNADTETIEWYNDMAMGIASTMEVITNNIENPTKNPSKGCKVIYLGSELFIPMRDLKKNLDMGNISLEEYIRQLDYIVDKLDQIIFENKKVLYLPKVRSHMKKITNAIILHLEGGPILNAMLQFLEDKFED